MSQRNGDKARFGKQRFAKTLRRKHMRELRKLLTGKPAVLDIAAAK